MADNGRVHPDCPNASNPYHECGVACLEKIAQGQGRKDKKKSGSFLETSLSFGRKKKGSDSQVTSPQVVPNLYADRKKKGSESQPDSQQVTTNISASKSVYPADSFSPREPIPAKKKVESEHSQSSSASSSQQRSEEIFSQDHSFEKGQNRSSEIEIVPASGDLKPNGSKSPKSLPLDSFTCFAIAPPETKQEDNGELDVSSEAVTSPTTQSVEVTNGPTAGSLNFTFSGISRATEDSDDEVQSVISDSCVSVGKYHVRANSASILQLILDKYGDIAANCKLESTSLRAYYLECLCSVVQELQSTPFDKLTKSKVKEFLAVLKDVESAQIDVSWLRDILNGLTEAVEMKNQQEAAEEAKANCNNLIESTKKELESMEVELAEKEKAIAEVRAKIDETKARLSELEHESAQLSETISSLSPKVEKFQSKPLVQNIL